MVYIRVGAGQDKLFPIVYEKNKHKKTNLEPHLWSYRQRVSLEHLGQTLQDAQLKEKCPILHKFLSIVRLSLQRQYCILHNQQLQEPSLRATQYLPSIVSLQKSLYEICNHRFDRKTAETQTIGEFLQFLGRKSNSSLNCSCF